MAATEAGAWSPVDGDRDRQRDEAESTSRSEFREDQEQEAWHSHLEDLSSLGGQYANDASASRQPGAADCEDFDFQQEAEAFYLGAGGPDIDLFFLDEDDDTEPCELLPAWYPGSDWYTNTGPP